MQICIPTLSISKSPDAKPRYAQSTYGNRFFSLQTVAIYIHSYTFGSTPVGLWAQASNRTIDPAFNLDKSSIIPFMSRPLVLKS